MPAALNLTGQKFGKLTVLHEGERQHNRRYWTCQCECGNIKDIRGDSLKDGSIVSCGCYAKEKFDITGKRFGKLTALYPTGEKHGTNTVWKLRCDCGKEIELDTSHLKSKRILSCGCDYIPYIDIVGQKFNHLLVVEDTHKRAIDGSVIWKCLCDCGNYTEVSSNNLKRNHTTSCGCNKSKGEDKISEILTKNHISFIKEKTFDDLIDKYKLRFDFYLPEYNCLIEYDGEQHFIYTDKTYQNYILLKQHDETKNQYAINNHINLIRISYKDYENITIENLLPKSSQFVFKVENLLDENK